jgi:hypothetical protein
MSLFTSDEGSKTLGSVRYLGWRDRDKPESPGEHVVTSTDMRRNKRSHSVHGPSGHQYRFRGQLGSTSQWLPVRSHEDRRAFEEADNYEVRRE